MGVSIWLESYMLRPENNSLPSSGVGRGRDDLKEDLRKLFGAGEIEPENVDLENILNEADFAVETVVE